MYSKQVQLFQWQTIDLQVNNPLIGGETPTSLTINRGHKFKTVYDGVNYPYVRLETPKLTH